MNRRNVLALLGSLPFVGTLLALPKHVAGAQKCGELLSSHTRQLIKTADTVWTQNTKGMEFCGCTSWIDKDFKMHYLAKWIVVDDRNMSWSSPQLPGEWLRFSDFKMTKQGELQEVVSEFVKYKSEP